MFGLSERLIQKVKSTIVFWLQCWVLPALVCTGCANKNNPHIKTNSYFSKDHTGLSQTFLPTFVQQILQFKVHLFKSICSDAVSILVWIFTSGSDVSLMNDSCLWFTATHDDTIASVSVNSCGKLLLIINKTVFWLSNIVQLWRVSLTLFKFCIPYMIINWLSIWLIIQYFYVRISVNFLFTVLPFSLATSMSVQPKFHRSSLLVAIILVAFLPTFLLKCRRVGDFSFSSPEKNVLLSSNGCNF